LAARSSCRAPTSASLDSRSTAYCY
jgi:hypothetical protein